MKNKLFLCFRPVGIETETESDGADSFDHQVLTCIRVSSHRESDVSVVKSSPASGSEKSSNFSENVIHTRKIKDSNKTFSATVRAILFEISLKKKTRNTKPPPRFKVGSKISDSSKTDVFFEISKLPKANSDLNIKRESIKILSHKKPSSLNQKKQSINKTTGSSRSSNSGLFLILISLAITVFYGRLCAIMFSSLCVYFMSHRSVFHENEIDPEKRGRSVPETARDYRKRVIMQGLLERNYQRREERALNCWRE